MITSSTPWRRSHSSMNAMNGRSTSGTTGLGTVEVSGRRRVPSPPTRMTACISADPPGAALRMRALAAADALVDESGGLDRRAVERVAPVDDDLAGHRGRHLRPVELLELVPLGHEDD